MSRSHPSLNENGKFRPPEPLFYVISQEDIRRSGATNIPDLLCMVPGMHGAQMNGSCGPSVFAASPINMEARFSDYLPKKRL
jgi:hypothetical protein